MLQPALDLRAARRWAVTARLMLAGARERIDALNVFPVADGDTGTNMYLTFDGALEYVRGQFELGTRTERLQEGLALIARGMLLSARGNSGVILAQLTRGLADSVGAEVEAAGPADIAAAFEAAAQTAWDSLAAPVEGTILTVARAAAEGARAVVEAGTGEQADVAAVVRGALAAAQEALARTPDQLPQLRAAGVVDAGGAGLVLVVEALESVLEDRPPGSHSELPDWWELPREHVGRDGPGPASAAAVAVAGGPLSCPVGTDAPAGTADGEVESEDGEVEVMFLLSDSDAVRAGRLRAHLGQLGSSVVVAGGPDVFQVHVHLDDARVAVEAGSLAGMVSQVRLTSLVDGQRLGAEALPQDLQDQMTQGPGEDGRPATARSVDVVACALGAGVGELFTGAGAQVVSSGPGRRASAGQLLAAIRASTAPCVVVLPNDPDTVLVARAAAAEATDAGRIVQVVPTRSLVQGLAAVAVLDPDGDPEHVVPAMRQAAAGMRVGALTRAERPADTPAGPCRPGQWLGIVDHAIVVVDDDLALVAGAVLDQLWHQGAEVVTVLLGERADEAVTGHVSEALAARARHTGPEVVTLRGDQPTYPVLLGVE